jgi:hypothetical protein
MIVINYCPIVTDSFTAPQFHDILHGRRKVMSQGKADFSKPDKQFAAVCGLFCPACTIYIGSTEDPERLKTVAQMTNATAENLACHGCHLDKRTVYCESCKMLKCSAEKGIDFCIECKEYPCVELKEFQAGLPHRIELWKSLERIKEIGFEKWYGEMVAHYSCPNCHTINSAYDIACRKCGASPGNAYVAQNREEILAQLAKMMPPGS